MDTFSKRMREAMSIRGLKQVDIVEKTKIGKSAISQYLSGICEPKQKNIYKIAQALNVNEAWLMGYDSNMEKNDFYRITELNNFPINNSSIENDATKNDKFRIFLSQVSIQILNAILESNKEEMEDKLIKTSTLILNTVIELSKLNNLGQEKANDYISDLLENVKYINK